MSDHSDIAGLQEKVERLRALVETSGILASSLELDEGMRLALEQAQGAANAEASAILLYDPETNTLEFEVALGEKGGRIQSPRPKIGLALGLKKVFEIYPDVTRALAGPKG
jgi:GAF domain-containing protein